MGTLEHALSAGFIKVEVPDAVAEHRAQLKERRFTRTYTMNLWPAYAEFCDANNLSRVDHAKDGDLKAEIRNLTLMRKAVEKKLEQLYAALGDCPKGNQMPPMDMGKTPPYTMRHFSYDNVSGDWKKKEDSLLDSLRKGNFIPQDTTPVTAVSVTFKNEHYEPPKKDDTGGKTFAPETWAAITRATHR